MFCLRTEGCFFHLPLCPTLSQECCERLWKQAGGEGQPPFWLGPWDLDGHMLIHTQPLRFPPLSLLSAHLFF